MVTITSTNPDVANFNGSTTITAKTKPPNGSFNAPVNITPGTLPGSSVNFTASTTLCSETGSTSQDIEVCCCDNMQVAFDPVGEGTVIDCVTPVEFTGTITCAANGVLTGTIPVTVSSSSSAVELAVPGTSDTAPTIVTDATNGTFSVSAIGVSAGANNGTVHFTAVVTDCNGDTTTADSDNVEFSCDCDDCDNVQVAFNPVGGGTVIGCNNFVEFTGTVTCTVDGVQTPLPGTIPITVSSSSSAVELAVPGTSETAPIIVTDATDGTFTVSAITVSPGATSAPNGPVYFTAELTDCNGDTTTTDSDNIEFSCDCDSCRAALTLANVPGITITGTSLGSATFCGVDCTSPLHFFDSYEDDGTIGSSPIHLDVTSITSVQCDESSIGDSATITGTGTASGAGDCNGPVIFELFLIFINPPEISQAFQFRVFSQVTGDLCYDSGSILSGVGVRTRC